MSPLVAAGIAIAIFSFFISAPKCQDESWLFYRKLDIQPIQIQSFSNIKKENEYNAIYSYIQSKFKTVDKKEAKFISETVVNCAVQYQMDPKLVAAVIAHESRFNKNAISATGAKGLGQIKDFNFKGLDIQNPFDIYQNINGTTKYLKSIITTWQKKFEALQDKNDKSILEDNKKKILSLALASYFKGYTGINKDKGYFDFKTKQYINSIYQHYQNISLLVINTSQKEEKSIQINSVLDAELEPRISNP